MCFGWCWFAVGSFKFAGRSSKYADYQRFAGKSRKYVAYQQFAGQSSIAGKSSRYAPTKSAGY